jgi:nucleoside-diphosphate-sugar epimerase
MNERRVLLTGATGQIGTAFFHSSGARYRFRLADLDVAGLLVAPRHEMVRMDVTDFAACRAACAGMDTVVHLAADPSPAADFHDSLLRNNIVGTYNVLRAARNAGCRRVVFASSLHAVAGHSIDERVGPDAPVRPLTMYGVSKCFGEATAAFFAYAEGMSCIAIRVGAYEAAWIRDQPSKEVLSAYISVRDMNHLLERCIEAPEIKFAIVHGISDNRIKRVDLTSTIALLDYRPQDDGFEIYGL